MRSGVTFKIERKEFDRTLRVYRQYSKKDPATICNTKALFITRGAILETPKADKRSIVRELGRIIKRGKNKGKLKLKSGTEHDAPLAALIINKRRGPGRGLYGAAMEEAVRAMLAARMRSIGFLKSGWIAAIRILLPFANRRGAPRQDRSAQQVGTAKGNATPAREGWRAKATFENNASRNRSNNDALVKFGGPALQRAFDAEERSMLVYIEGKMRESAKAAGIKTN